MTSGSYCGHKFGSKKGMLSTIESAPKKSSFLTSLYCITLLCFFSAALLLEKGQDVVLINGHHSPLLDDFFKVVTFFGDGIVFIPIVLATLFIRFELTLITIASWVGHGVLVSIFKRLLFPDSLRPQGVLNHDLLYYVPGVDVHSAHSFPSGHTATAFCAAFLIALIWRNNLASILALLLACLVAYSRVYLLQHFLLDVTAGAFIGCITASAMWMAFDFKHKPGWMSRSLKFNRSFWRSQIRHNA